MATSFLVRALAKLKTAIDEPSVNAKYSDSLLIEYLEESFVHVFGEIVRNSTTAPTVTWTQTLGDTTVETRHALPLCIGRIMSIEVLNSNSDVEGYALPRSRIHLMGTPYRIEGNTLWLGVNCWPSGYKLRFHFTPSATARIHYGTAGTIGASGTTVVLAAIPTGGTLDTRLHAYVGYTLRVLSATTNDYVQERTISAYDATTRTATVDPAFSPIPGGATVAYEVVPPLDTMLDTVVPLHAAYMIALVEGQVKRAQYVERAMERYLRVLRLNAANRDAYVGARFEDDTAFETA